MKIQGVDFTDIRVHEILAQAEAQDINWMPEYRDAIMDRAENGRQNTGLCLPWSKSHSLIRIRSSELILLGGYNGHLKTSVSLQIAAHLAKSVPVGVASLEMEIADTSVLMCQQAAGSLNPSKSFVSDFITWADNRIAIYDRLDAIEPETALACIYHMAANLGCKFIILDSLMMCGVTEDLERERRFITALAGIAKMQKVAIMLIHHMRKPMNGAGEEKRPGKYDFLGSSHLSNLAMTVLIAWHDKRKKEAMEFGLDYNDDDPDFVLTVAKQRHGYFEGPINLWMHQSRQFTPDKRRQPMPFKPVGVAA